jgi:RHS repeat-associated protein
VDRLLQRRYPDGTRHTFAWDEVGNRTLMADPTGRYTSMWDALDRRGSVNWPNKGRITYTWDAVGNRVGMLDTDGGVTTYQYDDADRIILLNNSQSERTSYAYDVASRRTVKRLANGTRASFTYDAANQITLLSNLKSDQSVMSSFDYEYDPVGNRTRVVEANGDRLTWSYDTDDQLTAEHRSGANAYARTYVYDPAGNRTFKVIDAARTTYAYDVANQLETADDASGVATYTFDANGNQRIVEQPTAARTTTIWDFENQPTLYANPDASRVTMAYNADNRRTEKVSADGTARPVWDPEIDATLSETDENDATTVAYTVEPRHYGRVISQRKAVVTETLHFDALGSTRQVTNGVEAVVQQMVFDSWGSLLESTGTVDTVLRWLSEWGYRSALLTDGYDVRRRVFIAGDGRWSSVDPLWHETRSAYDYVRNNPANWIDPSGLQTAEDYEQAERSGRPKVFIRRGSGTYEVVDDPRRPGEGWSMYHARRIEEWKRRRRPLGGDDWGECEDCPPRKPRTPKPGLDVDLGYGHFCGPFRAANCLATGIPSPNNPEPVDELDAACELHDCCLMTWSEFLSGVTQVRCNAALCAAALRKDICARSPNKNECEAYTAIVLGSPFCGGSAPVRPGRMLPTPLIPF